MLKIKTKLHKFLFPSQVKRIESLESIAGYHLAQKEIWQTRFNELNNKFTDLEKTISNQGKSFDSINDEFKLYKKTTRRVLAIPDNSDILPHMEMIARTRKEFLKTISDLNKEISILKEVPKPSMADLMRENLGVQRLNFNYKDGIVPNFLAIINPIKRKTYINQLAICWQQEAFQELCKNFIDFHGNFAIRTSNTEQEDWAARMTINGICEVRDAVITAHEEYIEGSKPKEELTDDEKFGTTEGVPFKNDNDEE